LRDSHSICRYKLSRPGLGRAVWTILFGCLAAVSALASSAVAAEQSYYRANGQKVYLAVQKQGHKLAIVLPGGKQSVLIGQDIIVRTHSDLRPSDSLLESAGLEVVRPLGGLESTWILRAGSGDDALAACRRLVEEGRVVWALPDFFIPVELLHVPDDHFYDRQWHLKHPDDQDIAVEDAWDITRGDSQVVVAVLDTGVDQGHADLAPARMVNPKNILSGSNDASPTSLAIDAHGTACMGLIAATADNQIGVSGVCPQCSWMPVRIFGDFAQLASMSQIAEGITYAADNGAWVISNSWGIGQELIDQGGFDMTPLYDAVRHAVNNGRDGKGSLVLFAAGNGDGNLNAQEIGPDELPAMDETMAIGGCDHNGTVARYSDFGSCVSVLAPTWSGWAGDPKIVSTDTSANGGYNKGGEWYVSEPGEGDVARGEPEPDEDGDYTAHFTGTSAATPIAAGVAALVLAANPELTYQEVIETLQSTAEQVGGVDYTDGHNIRYGYGRVHALRAVAVAKFGRDNSDGEACALDLNCSGICLTNPPASEPVCATPCVLMSDCAGEQICNEGFCVPEEPEIPDVVVKGGCACQHRPGPAAHGWPALMALLLIGLFRRRFY
jgi:MYXO-CTERM domain-containing protein